MKGNVIKEFLVGLGFKVDESSLNTFNSKISIIKQGLIALGSAAVVHAFTSVAEEMDKLNDLSNRINTPIDEIEEFSYVAKMAGSSVEAAQASLEGLSVQSGLAAIGMGRSKEVFKQLGISVKDTNGKLKSSAALMGEISSKIKKMERGQQTAILSRLGIDPTMIEALTSDVSGLMGEYRNLEKSFGFNAKKSAENAGLFMDAMDRMGTVVNIIVKTIVSKLLPSVTKLIDSFRVNFARIVPFIIRALNPLVEVFKIFAGILSSVFNTLGAVFDTIIIPIARAVGRLDEGLNGWLSTILKLIVAWKVFNVVFMRSPVGIILALVAAFALLMDDLMVFKEGGKSALDWTKFIQFANIVSDAFSIIAAVITPVLSLLGSFLVSIGEIANMLHGAFSSAFDKVFGLIGKFIDKMHGAWDIVKKVGGSISEFFGDDKNISVNASRVAAQTGGGIIQPYFSPAMATAGTQQTITQKTEINVVGSADPNATARSVSNAQNQVNADMARNMQGRAR